MESFREQRCRACLTVFWICLQCDRGQRYCRDECRAVGRVRSVRDAKRKYLSDPDVREGERERLRDYRARVRDQGSGKVATAASVPAAATSAPMDGADRAEESTMQRAMVPSASCGRRTERSRALRADDAHDLSDPDRCVRRRSRGAGFRRERRSAGGRP